jgi:hypothetical protein
MLTDGAFALEVGEFAPRARDRGCFARFSRAIVARLAKFLHVINYRVTVSVQGTILIRQQQRA